MGHSFVSYRGKHKRLNDTDIEVAIFVLDEIISSENLCDQETCLIIEDWFKTVKESFPGGIDLNLDSLSVEKKIRL